MKREELKHLVITGMIEGKRSKVKKREKRTDVGWIKWLNVGRVADVIKTIRHRGKWKVTITHA